jgi:hypothetical protein
MKKESFDILYGCEMIRPQLAYRFEEPPSRFIRFVAWCLRVLRSK